MAVTFVFVWFVGGLSGFHCYLVATNQTTYENFRYNNDDRPNPYNVGLVGNCLQVWCTPTPPSKVDFRAFLETSSVGDEDGGDLEGGAGGGSIARHTLPSQAQATSSVTPVAKPLAPAASGANNAARLESEPRSRENAALSQLKTQLEALAEGRVDGRSELSENGVATRSMNMSASLREIEPAVAPP